MPTATKTRVNGKRYKEIEKGLRKMEGDLRRRLSLRLNEVTIELEPDDEAAQAIDSMSKEFAADTLERERRTLQEVNAALERIKSGEYGICELCGNEIPEARLEALPWARLCVRCASRAGRAAAAD